MRDERALRAQASRVSGFVIVSAIILVLAALEPSAQTVPAAQAQVPPSAPAPAPPPARNPVVEAAAERVDKILADPTKKDALCAYMRAREAVGTAMSGQGTTGRTPGARERQQIEQFRTLGSAQGAARQAAGAVDPEFYQAMETLRIGDFREGIRVDLALRVLCKQ